MGEVPNSAVTEPYIETHSGGRFFLISPAVEDVKFYDIAHALSKTCRFSGHCLRFYSVAQHSVLTLLISRALNHPLVSEKAVLLHDAHEAYLADLSLPLKWSLPPQFRAMWKDKEEQVQALIHQRAGIQNLCVSEIAQIKAVDEIALYLEAWAVMPTGGRNWERYDAVSPQALAMLRLEAIRKYVSAPLLPCDAYESFLAHCHDLKLMD